MEKNRVHRFNRNNSKFSNIVYLLIGILEALLIFRLVFKILGANPGSKFVSLIYTSSATLLAPFGNIFRAAIDNGIENQSIIEPNTIIAIIVYALVAFGLVRLIRIFETPKFNKNKEIS